MSKLLKSFLLLIIFLIVSIIIILASKGIETHRFNNLVSQKINENNKDLDLEIKTIKFKIDIKNISLFLETKNPIISYRNIILPVKDIKVYINFLSLIKNETSIEKINLSFEQLSVKDLKELSKSFKPSNFNSFLNNRMKQGKLNTDIEVFLNEDNTFENFIARGVVEDLKAEIYDNTELSKTNFTFFADKSDILIKNFSSISGPIRISDGNIKFTKSSEILLESNFKAKIRYNDKKKSPNFFSNFINFENISNLDANIDNFFFINLDETYKVKKYDFRSNGKVNQATIELISPIENELLNENIKQLTINNSELHTNLSNNKKKVNLAGIYSVNKGNPQKFELENHFNKDLLSLNLNFDYDKEINLKAINYKNLVETLQM